MAPGLLRPYVPNCGMATGGPWFLRKGQEDTCPPPRNPCISMAIQTSNALLGPCRRNGESAPVLWACLLCRIIRWTLPLFFLMWKRYGGVKFGSCLTATGVCVCTRTQAHLPWSLNPSQAQNPLGGGSLCLPHWAKRVHAPVTLCLPVGWDTHTGTRTHTHTDRRLCVDPDCAESGVGRVRPHSPHLCRVLPSRGGCRRRQREVGRRPSCSHTL